MGKWIGMNAVFEPTFPGETITSMAPRSTDVTAFETQQFIRRTQTPEQELYRERYYPLTQIIEADDSPAKGHFGRVSLYARKIAECLGLSADVCKNLEYASTWHDVGKAGIPASILLARRKLTPTEYSLIQKHTTIGYRMLKKTSSLEMAANIAHFHHERYDGSGYPNGLQGEDIPIVARIVAVADVYDALRSWRPYKHPWPHTKAMRHIIARNGTNFDPMVVRAFLKLEPELQTIPLMHYANHC